MKRKYFFLQFLFLLIFFDQLIFAQISFETFDLDSGNQLLYKADYKNFKGEYSTLFSAELNQNGQKKSGDSRRILTCNPEQLQLLDSGKFLRISNEWGSGKYSFEKKSFEWTDCIEGFPETFMCAYPVCVSPDGNWICSVKPDDKKFSEGVLFLENVQSGEVFELSGNVPFSFSGINVIWSSNSRALVYESGGELYFATVSAVKNKIKIDSGLRRVGKGSIRNVQWADSGDLIYIDSDIVYLINENELYTRGMYSKLLGSGKIVGRLPIVFNPGEDSFRVRKSSDYVLGMESFDVAVLSGNRTCSVYYCRGGNEFVDIKGMYSFSSVPGSVFSCEVLWGNPGEVFLWLNYFSYGSGKKLSCIYSLGSKSELVMDLEDFSEPKVSFDGRFAAFPDSDSLQVYEISGWKKKSECSGEKIVSFLWKDSENLVVGGNNTTFLWNIYSGREFLFLSSADKACWIEDKVYAQRGNDFYVFDSSKNIWEQSLSGKEFSSSERNASFRVYTSDSKNEKFSNAIFVRSLLKGSRTYSLFAETEIIRKRPKTAYLIVDAMNSTEGLSQVLNSLKEFNVDATFFVNGEFIRRYPKETKGIVLAGYKCASAFYTDMDFSSRTFYIEKDFIRRGLARNEDEFFDATGKELSLMWHSPNYYADEKIVTAGEECGYYYIHASPCGNMEELLQKLSDGIIIPVSPALSEKTGTLISEILRRGYRIIPLERSL